MVWPKFKICRRPPSRSSLFTTSALIPAQRGMMRPSAVRIAPQNCGHALFKKTKELEIGDHSVLHHFVQARTKFAVRQRLQDFWIGENQFGRIKGANEIFPFGQIDAGFPADGAVHLGDERGGNVNELHTAQIACRYEAHHIAYDPTADGDDDRVAVCFRSNQRPGNGLYGRNAFELLAIVEEDGITSAGNFRGKRSAPLRQTFGEEITNTPVLSPRRLRRAAELASTPRAQTNSYGPAELFIRMLGIFDKKCSTDRRGESARHSRIRLKAIPNFLPTFSFSVSSRTVVLCDPARIAKQTEGSLFACGATRTCHLDEDGTRTRSTDKITSSGTFAGVR